MCKSHNQLNLMHKKALLHLCILHNASFVCSKVRAFEALIVIIN